LKANYKVLGTGRGHLLAPAPSTELRGMHGSESVGLERPGQSGRVASQERETPIRVEAKHCTVERGDGSYDSTSLFLYIRQLL
jgi:hypothetical protein